MADVSCLAENYVVSVDPKLTGLNLNEVIVGTTGCGKSMSITYPRLAHTTESSVVVPLAKGMVKEKFVGTFRKRGYKVIDLDFTRPEKCDIGYDPMDYIHRDEDVILIARNLVGLEGEDAKVKFNDPYWQESAASVIAAEINLVRLNAKTAGKKASFADVIDLHRSIKVDYSAKLVKFNIDVLFDKADEQYPGNQASELWKTIRNLSEKTASCILSVANNAMDKIFTENVIKMMRKNETVDFKFLGEEKTALFITTSPVNKSLQNLVNLMYSDMFRELFESAEGKPDGRLDIPVHIICDDFACGSRIPEFEDYISIFRAAGISVTLLLQSETQLSSMYGKTAAVTIINNCDTYVYMGGMDLETCHSISQRINKPPHKILSMKREQVIVFRRGSEPVVARRYQTLKDPVYLEAVGECPEAAEEKDTGLDGM